MPQHGTPGRNSPLLGDNPSQHGSSHDINEALASDQALEVKQDAMKNLIKNNLYCSTECTHLEAVLAMHTPKDFEIEAVPKPTWPAASTSSERSFYKGLAAYLNSALTAARAATASAPAERRVEACALEPLFGSNFRWFSYDKNVLGNVQSGADLKPDLLGCILNDPNLLKTVKGDKKLGDNEYIAWKDAITFAEVKNSWPDMVAQSATYARQIFANQPDRVAVRCVMFNQATKDAAIAEFDRSGAYATRLHRLTKDADFKRFSLLLAGMYCSSTDAHGYNRRIQWQADSNGKLTSLNVLHKGEVYDVKDILCNRIGLWGRVTRALSIEKGQGPQDLKLKLKGNANNDMYGLEEDIDKLNLDLDSQEKQGESQKTAAPSGAQSVGKRPKLPQPQIQLPSFNSVIPSPGGSAAPVLIDYWQPHAHRRDDDRAAIKELLKIKEELPKLKEDDKKAQADKAKKTVKKADKKPDDAADKRAEYSVRGIVNYGGRQEARVTFFAQGPANASTDIDYYYKDKYECNEDNLFAPKQQVADSGKKVHSILTKKSLEGGEDKFNPEGKLFSSLGISSGSGATKLFAPIPRYETLQECLDLGTSLMDARNGFELLDGILGALYGYRNLWCLGYLHRDISPGNIILVEKDAREGQTIVDIGENAKEEGRGEVLKLPKALEDKHYTIFKNPPRKSNGMLIDLSLAIKRDRKKPHSDVAPGLTGTRLFLPTYLLENVNAQCSYSAVFDIESFLWTLVYAVLRNRKKSSDGDKKIWNRLVSTGNRAYDDDVGAKSFLLSKFRSKRFADKEGVLITYEPLLNKLAGKADKYLQIADDRDFEAYSKEQEAEAINDTIAAFEDFLDENKTVLKKDEFK